MAMVHHRHLPLAKEERGGGLGACRRALVSLVQFSSGVPPPPNTSRQVLVQGAKVCKHKVAVFGQAHVSAWHAPRNTCCRRIPTLPLKT